MQPRRAADSSATPGTTNAGFLVLELLIVLACLAIGTGFILNQQPARLQAASDVLRTRLVQGRLEAISEGAPVVITFNPAEREYQLRAATGPGPLVQACTSPGVSSSVRLDDYSVVTQEGVFKGLIWLPTGTGRDCRGGGASNQTIKLPAGHTRSARHRGTCRPRALRNGSRVSRVFSSAGVTLIEILVAFTLP